MLTRIITSVVALAVFFAVLWAGVLPFQIAIGIVILIMLWESYNAITKSRGVKAAGYIGALLLMAGLYIDAIPMALCAMIILFMICVVFTHGKLSYREVMSAGFMTAYVTLFMGVIALMRENMGLVFTGFIFLCAWGSDTSAYFCGTFLGKHKLIPHVSPKKTVEGAVGAIVCVMFLCMLYAFIMEKTGHSIEEINGFNGYMKIGAMGAVASAVSQLGDLAASSIKRDANIKDYGFIFPGHGGFMDRFDSVLFVAPVVYYYCLILLG